VDRKVGEIVRYLLCAERRKAPVKKSELIDKAIGSEFSSCFSCFIPLAKERLSEFSEELRGTRFALLHSDTHIVERWLHSGRELVQSLTTPWHQ
jgi:hypothetical protein